MIFPNEIRRGFVYDRELAYEATQYTPFGLKKRPRTPEEAMAQEGCAVKSREREVGGMPKYCGRVSDIDKEVDQVTIVDADYVFGIPPTWVWLGTWAEYNRVWECD